jgi:hypothetical protein
VDAHGSYFNRVRLETSRLAPTTTSTKFCQDLGVVKLHTGRTEPRESALRHVRDHADGVQEWEFMCECGHESCRETVFLTLDAFEALRGSGQAALADGHVVSQVARARRLRSATKALRAQAAHQVTRAKKNLGLM